MSRSTSNVCGIELAPINVPLKRRLQTATVLLYAVLYVFSLYALVSLFAYFTLFSPWRWLALIYLVWAWIVDAETDERGGRSNARLLTCNFWRFLKDYFPLNLKKMPDVELDPKKNYLFCCFPHGVLSTGLHCNLHMKILGFNDLFPHHTVKLITLKSFFRLPLFREVIMSSGFCSATKNSINYLLNFPGGGKIVALVIGGIDEALRSHPGTHKVVLKDRKGFVRAAIKTGSPLVPVYTFGETDLYRQWEAKRGSLFHGIQKCLMLRIGIPVIIMTGRGLFQYSFGFLPLRKPVTTIVGRPIEVERVENPTSEQVNALHETFILSLSQLFEENKHLYLTNSENAKLEIEQ